MAIVMSVSEIVKSFKNNPKSSQVNILAQLNGCDRLEILDVLKGEGIDITKLSMLEQKRGRKPKEKSSTEQTKKDDFSEAEIKVNLDEQKIERCPVPDYYIPDSVHQIVQKRIDEILSLIILHTEAVDKLNREKLELEHFMKGEFKDYGKKNELFGEV